MKINIVGWYGKNNVGDEAFRYVFKQFFASHDVAFYTPPEQCPPADIVILGGGAVASPYYLSTLPNCTKYAIGIDLAYESEADLLDKANFRGIYVRTKSDAVALEQKVHCPVTAIPDLAFYIKTTGTPVLNKYKKTDRPVVGVLVTDYVNPAIDRPPERFGERAWNFKVKLAAELDLLWEQGYEVVLIPCSTGGYGDDRRINLDLAAFMKYPPVNIFDTLSPQTMVDLIRQCEFTICQRFHAHIFSIIAGVPFVSIEFTRKVRLLLEENNLTNWIGGLYQNKSNFDFSKLPDVSRSFSQNDRSMLKDLSATYRLNLERIKNQVVQEFNQPMSSN